MKHIPKLAAAISSIVLLAPTIASAETTPFAVKLIGSSATYTVPAGFHVRIDVASVHKATPSQQSFELISASGGITHPYYLENFDFDASTPQQYYTQTLDKPIYVASGWRIKFPITSGSNAQLAVFGLLVPSDELFASHRARKGEELALFAAATPGALDLKLAKAPSTTSVVTTEKSADLKTWSIEQQKLVGPSATPSTLATVPTNGDKEFFRSSSRPAKRGQ